MTDDRALLEAARPDYVTCINRQMQANLARSWCGRSLFGVFAFEGLDHAAESNLQRGRLVPCPECVAAACAALQGARGERMEG